MDNPWDTMRAAIAQAKSVSSAADQMTRELAGIMRGRLRQCRPDDLVRLKRELRDFNMHTGKWKS